MNRYVLDTDIVSLLQGGNPAVMARCAAMPRDELAISVITVEEILSSWFTQLRRARTKAQLARAYHRLAESTRFVGALAILSFSEAAIDRFEQLKARKLGVKAPDLRIASIALEHQAIVVTRNLRDFQLIAELKCEDWSLP
jgi:tRNA(fMet)-specific endonuclease VapC